jgi:hypothetical protein
MHKSTGQWQKNGTKIASVSLLHDMKALLATQHGNNHAGLSEPWTGRRD